MKAKERTHCSTSHQERKSLQHQQCATSSQQEDGGYSPGTEVMNKCYAGDGCAWQADAIHVLRRKHNSSYFCLCSTNSTSLLCMQACSNATQRSDPKWAECPGAVSRFSIFLFFSVFLLWGPQSSSLPVQMWISSCILLPWQHPETLQLLDNIKHWSRLLTKLLPHWYLHRNKNESTSEKHNTKIWDKKNS